MTEMIPTAPKVIRGKVMPSSPEITSKFGGFIFYDVIHLADISRCFFNCYYILKVACDAQGCFGFHIYSGTSRYIIKYNRKVGSLGNRFIMLINPFLGRLVIIRTNRQDTVDATPIPLPSGL